MANEWVLSPKKGVPGSCLPLMGSDGVVDIKLRNAIQADGISVEHIPKSIAYDITSAPKNVSVFGWYQKRGSPTSDQIQLVSNIYYDIEGRTVQTFNFEKIVQPITHVRFKVGRRNTM